MALRRNPARSALKGHRAMVREHHAHATSKPAAYVTEMAKKLGGADVHEKLVIAHSLAKVDHPANKRTATKLLAKLTREKEELIVRRTAVVGLGHLKTAEHKALLEKILNAESSPQELKRDAAWALKKIEGKKGFSLSVLKEAVSR